MVARVTYSSCDNSGLNGGLSVDVCSRQTDFRRTLCIREIGAMIGRGAFGQVFEASAYLSPQDKETTKVALKKLKDMATSEEIKNFRLEFEQMLNVGPHPNIIGLYGSIMHEGQLCIVMEYAELGDLLTYLRTDVTSPTQYVRVASNGHVIEQTTPEVQDNALLMMFAWQICKGMKHLEMHRNFRMALSWGAAVCSTRSLRQVPPGCREDTDPQQPGNANRTSGCQEGHLTRTAKVDRSDANS
ncbi:receptor protein-tyrosine kinase [Elysia marginata]|uniref:Receptor protein-tyrosine kinase n=1 Tax=Elysia marginata TaxID=1093978 RepID=A0AAV4G7T6_9GAST|nr:receptor protein-tyrosine kinase [Elysia marginata]